MVNIHFNIPRPLCHYIANRLTSATICLSCLSDDVYLSRAQKQVTAPLPPPPRLLPVNLFIQGTVPLVTICYAYYIIRVHFI